MQPSPVVVYLLFHSQLLLSKIVHNRSSLSLGPAVHRAGRNAVFVDVHQLLISGSQYIMHDLSILQGRRKQLKSGPAQSMEAAQQPFVSRVALKICYL